MESIYQAKDLSKSFGIGRFSMEPLDISINPGEIVGIVGENGNGKTTLLRLIAGELSRDAGEITFFDQRLNIIGWEHFKKSIAYIPQRIPKWHGNLRNNLIFQASLLGYTNQDELVDILVEKLGLEEYVNLNWSEISTGYRLRFQLAKMLIGNPKLLVLDEPIANLDVNAQEKFLSDLRNIVSDKTRNVGVVFSSQQLNEVENVSDKVIFLRKGKLIFGGEIEKIGEERLENSFELQISGTDLLLSDLFPNATIHGFGKSVRLDTDLNMDANQVLKILLDNNITVQYFRNISSSTKRMFKQ
jgi:ABC-2 type transport system ATP-binding protein